MLRRLLILWLLLLTACQCGVEPQPDHVGIPGSLGGDARPRRCIAILGQSNAPGRKFIEQVSAPQHDLLIAPYANVPLKEWESQFTDPFTVLYDEQRSLQPRPFALPTPNMGVELSFGHGIDAYAPNQFGIIKCGVGSTTLALEWNPAGHYPVSGPNLYHFCTNYVQQAAVTLGCQVSIIWLIQGESDALDVNQSAAYQANLTALIAQLRLIWPGVPFIVHRLPATLLQTTVPNYVSVVRAAQLAVVAATPKTGWVDSDNLPLDSFLHFVSDSYVALGYRAVPVALNAMGYALPPVASYQLQATARAVTFTDTSTDPNTGSQVNPPVGGSITSWNWDFGDGNTSTSENTSHTYSVDGAYTVKLTVKNGAGLSNTSTQVVTVAQPTWTVDVASGIGWPSTGAEWTAFETAHALTQFGVPNQLYTFQQASGSITDVIGGKNLLIGNAPLYQKTITGWSRKAIGGNAAATTQSASVTTLGNVSTNSVLVLVYLRYDAATAANRAMVSAGSSAVNELEAPGGLSTMRLRATNVNANGALTHAGNTVHPYWIIDDVTNQRNCILSDKEKLCVTWNAQAGTSLINTFSLGSDVGPVTDVLAEARWEGAAAERTDNELRSALQGLAWAPSGW